MKREILDVLEKNGRVSVTDLATMLGEPENEVAAAISSMEKEKIICGYHTLINWDKACQDRVTALIEVKVTPQRDEGFDAIAEKIYNFKEVTSVYLMSGAFDLTVIIEGKTMKEVALFVGQRLAVIDAVLSTATHFVLKKYKDHGFIMDVEKKDERMLVSP